VKPIRTRFAPSPTGSLHVGGVRTALYCLLYARKHGGAFLLRIEDTDRVRSTEEATAGIVRDLGWLGLAWDEGPGVGGPVGPYLQSQRLSSYRALADRLLAEGKAYLAWETPAELEAERKRAEARKENYRYRRKEYSDAELKSFADEGRLPVVRLQAPGHAVTVSDVVLGDVTVEAEGLDDFVLVKADGFPTYHFAVVADDHAMGVTLVLRGQEHLMNTHKHMLLYEAFGWAPPAHGHLPLIFNPSGAKMSKREKAKAAREAARAAAGGRKGWGWLAELAGVVETDLTEFMEKKNDGVSTAEAIARALQVSLPMIEVADFRRAGVLPEALLNAMALLGWGPGDDREILSLDEMVEAFDLSRVQRTPARFDGEKLLWINATYLKSLPDQVLLQHLAVWIEASAPNPIARYTEDERRLLLAMYRPRARTFADILTLGAFLFLRPETWDRKQVDRHLGRDGGWERLARARQALTEVDRWDVATLHAVFDRLVDQSGEPMGKWAQPVRVAISGDGVSPEIAETLALLGREETLARLAAIRPASGGVDAEGVE